MVRRSADAKLTGYFFIEDADGMQVPHLFVQLTAEQQALVLQGLDLTAENDPGVTGDGHHRGWSKKGRPQRGNYAR